MHMIQRRHGKVFWKDTALYKSMWCVIRIKCAGRNNFHTNHFWNPIILGLFRPSPCWFRWTFLSSLSPTKWRQRTYLAMVNMTPSLLLLMFSWDNDIPTSSVFTFWQAKTSPLWQYLANRAAGGSSLCLPLHLKSWTEAAARTAKSYCTETSPGITVLDFSAWKLAGTWPESCWWMTLMVLQPDFSNSGGNSNHGVGGPFRCFHCVSSLTALMKEISWFYNMFLL